MDKNTLIGFVLMGLVIFGMTWINQPSPEQIAAKKRYQDSIAQIDAQHKIDEAVTEINKTSLQEYALKQMLDTIANDSAKQTKIASVMGGFASAFQGTEEVVTLENDLIKLQLTSKGGRILSAELRKFKAQDEKPLILFDNQEASFNTTYITANNQTINTRNLFFQTLPIKEIDGVKVLTLRLVAGENSYIDYVYTLKSESYMVGFSILPVNMQGVLAPTMKTIDIEWASKLRQQEKGRKFEERYAQIYYKPTEKSSIEYLSDSKDDKKELEQSVKWVAFKDQFFSSVLIADNNFKDMKLSSRVENVNSPYLKSYTALMTTSFDQSAPNNFNFYLGPNHYPTLMGYDDELQKADRLELHQLVPLGAFIFRWVNQIFVIPMFNFLNNYISSFGMIIFIMTLVVKLVLFPLTRKSYFSSAKMRVLRPQIEEITKQFPGDDNAMKRQQATMELYSRAGVSPMSGCLPMLLQMPVLIALFQFFPSAIELRQEGFLWANDLSTYDAVLTWDAQIPFISTYFGNHLSLFCLLMTIVNIVYTKFNMEMSNTGQEQMPGMKMMMYFMPVMFLVFFNQYPAGLSYYYLLSTLFSILQTIGFRYVVNEEKLLAQLEENKKRPRKTNGFMSRMAEMQKQQQELMRQQQSERNKNKK